jgi:hypothetical protein
MPDKLFKINLLSHNIAEVVMEPNVYLDVSVTDMIDQELNRLAPDKKFYQLVIASGPYIVNPEMRNSMSEGGTGIKLLGVAWVSPDEKANREQEQIISTLTLPVPVRFFSDRTAGLNWLKQEAASKTGQ